MSRIIKNKIEFTMAGVPTWSDKYDVVSAMIPIGKSVKPGQIVDLEKVLSGTGDWTTVTSSTNRYGIVMHQNVQLGRELIDGNVVLSDNTTTYNGGISVGILIKGFASVIGKSDISTNTLPTKVSTTGELAQTSESGALDLKNLTVTRAANSALKLFEVEVI